MKNILGREIPEFIEGYGNVKQYKGYLSNKDGVIKKDFKFKTEFTVSENSFSVI